MQYVQRVFPQLLVCVRMYSVIAPVGSQAGDKARFHQHTVQGPVLRVGAIYI